MATYGRKISDFADWCAGQGMPLAYHHHMAAAVETEAELDLLMKHASVSLLYDAGHMAFAGGDVMRVIENHHARITHVGISLGGDAFLHANGARWGISIQSFDPASPVFDTWLKENYRGARRYGCPA